VQTWGGENIFYKNDPAFNPCIDYFLFTYQKLEKIQEHYFLGAIRKHPVGMKPKIRKGFVSPP